MLNHAIYRWTVRSCVMGATLVLFGCSSSKPYTLVAQLPPLSQQERMVAATIDVTNSVCSVRFVMLDSSKTWKPACVVNKDQPTYKSLTIDRQEVDFGAVGDGFKVLSTTLPTLPAPAISAAPAVTNAKTAATTQTPAVTTTNAIAAASGPVFPSRVGPGSLSGPCEVGGPEYRLHGDQCGHHY